MNNDDFKSLLTSGSLSARTTPSNTSISKEKRYSARDVDALDRESRKQSKGKRGGGRGAKSGDATEKAPPTYRDRAAERREEIAAEAAAAQADPTVSSALYGVPGTATATHTTTSTGTGTSGVNQVFTSFTPFVPVISTAQSGVRGDAADNEYTIEQSKFLGGSVDNTHKVRGLDFNLLRKVRADAIADMSSSAHSSAGGGVKSFVTRVDKDSTTHPNSMKESAPLLGGVVTCTSTGSRTIHSTNANPNPIYNHVLPNTVPGLRAPVPAHASVSGKGSASSDSTSVDMASDDSIGRTISQLITSRQYPYQCQHASSSTSTSTSGSNSSTAWIEGLRAMAISNDNSTICVATQYQVTAMAKSSRGGGVGTGMGATRAGLALSRIAYEFKLSHSRSRTDNTSTTDYSDDMYIPTQINKTRSVGRNSGSGSDSTVMIASAHIVTSYPLQKELIGKIKKALDALSDTSSSILAAGGGGRGQDQNLGKHSKKRRKPDSERVEQQKQKEKEREQHVASTATFDDDDDDIFSGAGEYVPVGAIQRS